MKRAWMLSALVAAVSSPGVADASAARVWFTAGEQFRVVQREAPSAEAALRALLKGPTAAERRADVETQIPAGAALEELVVGADRDALVELPARFMKGVPLASTDRSVAQTATFRARLAQVVYTATQFDAIASVTVAAGGTVVAERVGRSEFARPATYPDPVSAPAPRGEPNAKTTALQGRLADLGYLPRSAVDGHYGYRTSQAVMAFQAWEGLSRDGVAGPMTEARLAKARRPRPFGSGPARRIEVDRARGVLLLVRSNTVIRAIHVSTGAGANATPTGSYKVFRKELRSWSVPYSVWLPYASYFNNGIAFHESPDVPAFPASHGCVRVPAPEAPEVYGFARLNTVVVVR